MGFNEDHVMEILGDSNFEIVGLETPEENITRLTIVHELHPDDEVQIDIVSKTEDGEDVMEMNFTGPDIWTDEEAKAVLQQVMDTLVRVIETALEEEPPAEESSEESSEEGEESEN